MNEKQNDLFGFVVRRLDVFLLNLLSLQQSNKKNNNE